MARMTCSKYEGLRNQTDSVVEGLGLEHLIHQPSDQGLVQTNLHIFLLQNSSMLCILFILMRLEYMQHG